MARVKRYRGDYREIDELEVGGSVILKKPDDLTAEQFASSVHNAINHFGRTRGRAMRMRSTKTGSVEVRRIHTEAEVAEWAARTAPRV